ncbi:hypothetical protein KSP40_PGU021799 [Platanthera guangdongensis]|uniref:Uncharacterized protein n=1 Tax=Platanthera guangdongensis TaxID=2320717 RepID=A0ABR2N3H2_9ASPA
MKKCLQKQEEEEEEAEKVIKRGEEGVLKIRLILTRAESERLKQKLRQNPALSSLESMAAEMAVMKSPAAERWRPSLRRILEVPEPSGLGNSGEMTGSALQLRL